MKRTDKIEVGAFARTLRRSGIYVYAYDKEEDRMVFFSDQENCCREVLHWQDSSEIRSWIHPEDRDIFAQLLKGSREESAEIRMVEGGSIRRKQVELQPVDDRFVTGIIRDVTVERLLEEQAQRDSLTGLYNRSRGTELISTYLSQKDPYASCGLMMLDIDYFKGVNDSYGHLFGDRALETFAQLLLSLFRPGDVIMRVSGDGFVVLLKDIDHNRLVKKAGELVEATRRLRFSEETYHMTCSAGVCFLPENISGYTYEQLFGNADWALCRAKETGRNRYVFCDCLRRYETWNLDDAKVEDVDARYLHNDIISTAFEIFEKMNNFSLAIHLLLKVIGYQFDLDRITVVRTDVKGRLAGKQYQWCAEGIPGALDVPGSFRKEDFLTLFHSYDEHGTTVLQYDSMYRYSDEARDLLMQRDAKTVLYAALYQDGSYIGAISYVVCKEKRYWSEKDRKQLGEVTKLISIHMAKNPSVNALTRGASNLLEYDCLTGLISFSRFKEEVERRIVGELAGSYVIIYTDFENFKYFNQQYGYCSGDQLLKDFCDAVMENMKETDVGDIYFSRVVSDQFILFRPVTDVNDTMKGVERINREFCSRQMLWHPEVRVRLRSGIYVINASCESASEAIDAANYARKQIQPSSPNMTFLYDENLAKQQELEIQTLNGIGSAIRNHEIEVYFQPKVRLEDNTVAGAEALSRWRQEDGTLMEPDLFIATLEKDGRIVDLDFYVLEQVAAFLSKCRDEGRKLLPVAVNGSILHAQDADTVEKYRAVLEQYGVDPSLIEVELTETATVNDYDNIRRLFQDFQTAGFHTSMDDFGAGYSILNVVVDVPVDAVKLDKAFLMNCMSSEKGRTFLKFVIRVMKGLEYKVICEGIETKEQAEFLRQARCDLGQGYWFSKPLPAAEYEKLLDQEK
ncbi:EAL domain-containing protein [Oscillospiraceae bacterium Marseille-Q3528]|nr:EAL domain-containing protein [Oscillospiraceae bacterium Marseille-Q3528]